MVGGGGNFCFEVRAKKTEMTCAKSMIARESKLGNLTNQITLEGHVGDSDSVTSHQSTNSEGLPSHLVPVGTLTS